MQEEQSKTAEAPGELPGGLYRLFPALSVRNFRLFIMGQSVSLIGTWMQGPVLSWVAYELTKSKIVLGYVSFLALIPLTLLVIPAGVVADKYSRRAIVTITQVVLMLVALALGVLAAFDALTIHKIYVLVCISGIAKAFDVPARQAFIGEVVGRKHLGNAVALNSAMFNAARILGPSVGGIVFAIFRATACFFINAASFVAIIAAMLSMKDLPQRATRKAGKNLRDFADGIKYAMAHGDIRVILLLTAVFSLYGTYYTTLLPAFAQDIYGKGAKEYGLVVSSLGVGALLSALVLATRGTKGRHERWCVGGLFLQVAGALALAHITSYLAACLIVGIYGFGMASFLISGNILLQHLVEEEYRGRIMAARMFVFGGMAPFGSWLAGQLAEVRGLVWTVSMGSLVVMVSLVILSRQIWRVDIRSDSSEKATDQDDPASGAPTAI